MINNSDIKGHFQVFIYGPVKQVAGFQCPTMVDVYQEAQAVVQKRTAEGKQTGKVIAQAIEGKDIHGLQLGREMDIKV
jgi:hypothetical protein